MDTLRVVPLLVLTLGTLALAHGAGSGADLRGARLCLDSSSVQLRFHDIPAARQHKARTLKNTLHTTLTSALKHAGVPYETRTACQKNLAYTQLLTDVRYLNPKNYQGFGDPAYSYSLRVTVGSSAVTAAAQRGARTKIHYASVLNDIHSEARTKQSFEQFLGALGREQSRHLVLAWRKHNP
ncbi:hypothetical protein GCM10008955_42090 [Deinococcus malanensis]|uniref:DUF4410 domain-containing protein n=1 Tax=Deinococcus malanensis TaxID=1706855 RepID=A0ABQ2F5K5_9DEIO|nr:hypothetical protein [Deinococcus malanensis]GGK43934.1 hypothetical protein GCM10008955_42090 [Deinococcus malanensis]